MSELEIKNAQGKVVGKHKLADAVASLGLQQGPLHRTVVAENANARQGTQSARTRSDARGGGRKPYKQKKTGNARQGTIRAPHYAHGGVAFAPKPRDYGKKVNKKERRLAIISAFSAQVEAGNVLVTDKIAFAEPRTKQAVELLKAYGLDSAKRVLVVVSDVDPIVTKSFRNIPSVEVRTAASKEGKSRAFSARDLAVAHKILITKDALERSEEAWTK
ncbi:MAG TPA: 50S ribosomal protein L4 [Fimbriimonadaceae bacterium]|nr:50S ribosomal protein L4 [Fimbriimonadaceae bacterium]